MIEFCNLFFQGKYSLLFPILKINCSMAAVVKTIFEKENIFLKQITVFKDYLFIFKIENKKSCREYFPEKAMIYENSTIF